MKEFGEIGTAGLPDSEISETYSFQSKMHFDDSVESNADSDLEDGKLQPMLTSPLFAQKTSGKPDAMLVQEREVSAQFSQGDREGKFVGNPMHCFHLSRENLVRSSVFRNVDPSNLRGSLFEGNKDHFLNQARSDLAKQELHVASLHKCIVVNNNDKQKSID